MNESMPRRKVIGALEGLRGLAALGVLVTHVSFQTGLNTHPLVGHALARLDLAVAVFFALSGFLLWRPHSEAAAGGPTPLGMRRYWLHRVGRILPAYLMVVVVVLAVLRPGHNASVWLANLTLTQVFVPLTFTQGLTQMWSLSVEVAFYVLLPILAVMLHSLSRQRLAWRVPVIAAVGVLALGWPWVSIPLPAGVNSLTWLPGFLPWFVVGMLTAEFATRPAAYPRLVRFAAQPMLMIPLAAGAFGLAATDLAGPPDLEPGARWQYAVKIALGGVIGFALIASNVLRDSSRSRLAHPLALAVGRWSYGIFVWHLVVLIAVFQVFDIPNFGGNFWLVLLLTVGLTIPVAAISYALVEDPARRALNSWIERREADRRDRPDQEQLNPAVVT